MGAAGAKCTKQNAGSALAKQLESQVKSGFEDYAQGLIVGAWVGDSAGSLVEFQHPSEIDDNKLSDVLKMPGGGCWELGPGQITDDSELAICLMSGIIKGCRAAGEEGKGPVLDMDAVGRKYGGWIASKPFDIGNATKAALSPLCTSSKESRA